MKKFRIPIYIKLLPIALTYLLNITLDALDVPQYPKIGALPLVVISIIMWFTLFGLVEHLINREGKQ